MKRISFSDPMMRALFDGAKFETRRPVRGVDDFGKWEWMVDHLARCDGTVILPPIRAGEVVAATCAWWLNDSGESRTGADYRFERDGWESEFGAASPAMFMPAALAPVTLRITDVRAEQLGQITNLGALDEGAVHWWESETKEKVGSPGVFVEPRDCYEALWEHIYGDGAWERDFDAWVWVYRFEWEAGLDGCAHLCTRKIAEKRGQR